MSDFQFPSKAIQIDGKFILLECGSIYVNILGEDFTPYYIHKAKSTVKAPKKEKKVVGAYTEEFEYMWKHWQEKIPNTSNKKTSFLAFKQLNQESKDRLAYSIDPYSKTNENPMYLMRCETYINKSHFENIKGFEVAAKDIIPRDGDPIWNTKIINDIGIVTWASKQIKDFGMSREEAFKKIQEIK